MPRQNPTRSVYPSVADEERPLRARLVSAASVIPFKRCPMCPFARDTLADFRKDDPLRYIATKP